MSFRTLTPVKYQVAQQDKEALLTLEERLVEFIVWLEKLNVILAINEDQPGRLGTGEVNQLIREYVES